MPNHKQLVVVGQRFSRLVVIAPATPAKSSEKRWLCRCDCGTEKVIRQGKLRGGEVRSCGCLARESAREIGSTLAARALTKHGHTVGGAWSATYSTWSGMLQRCERPSATNYSRYGALGVSVCERWHEFAAFLADMGERPEGRTLDRIDPMGNYEPGNCRWATLQEQRANRRPR